MHAGDAAHGVVDAVSLEATITQNLPALHAGEDVLDASSHLLVGRVVCDLPVGKFLARAAAMRHHQAGTRIAAVRDRSGGTNRVPGAGFRPCLAVIAVARKRLTDHDDEPASSASMTTWWLVEYR